MARVEVLSAPDLSDFTDKIKEDRALAKQIAELIIERIRNLARTKKRMEQNGGNKRLPTLSDSYQAMRKGEVFFRRNQQGRVFAGDKRDDRLDTTGQFFRPRSKFSNLTFTGQLLESLEYEILDDGMIEIRFNNDSRTDTDSTNEEVFQFLVERNSDYNVMQLSKKIQAEIIELIRRRVAREINRVNS